MSDTKHGWVTPRADGARARCGGPAICGTCQTEQMHETMLNGLFGAKATPLPSQPSEEGHRAALGIARAALVEIGNLADVDADDRSTIVRIALGNIDKFLAAHATNLDVLAQAAADLAIFGASVVRIAPADAAAIARTAENGGAPRPSWLDGGGDAVAMAREDGLLPAAPAAGDALNAARLDWLEQHDGRFYNKDRISSIVGVGFIVAGDLTGMRHQSVRAAIDAAIAAQRKGDA